MLFRRKIRDFVSLSFVAGYLLLGFLGWCLSASRLLAQPGIESASVLEADNDHLTIEQVVKSTEWKPITASQINLNQSEHPRWFRFHISQSQDKNTFLSVENPMLYHVSLYTPNAEGGFNVEETGFLHKNRNVFGSRYFVFALQEAGSGLVYLKVASRTPLQIPISVRTAEATYDRTSYEFGIFSAMIGIIFAFSLYNFFIFLRLRRRAYLYYSLYSSFLAMVFVTTEGFLPSWTPIFIKPLLIHAFSAPAFAFLVLFTRKLLRTITFPIIDRSLRFLATACVSIPFLAALFGDLLIWHAAGSIFAGLAVICCFIAAIKQSRKSHVAKIYMLAFVSPIVGTILYTSQLAGTIPKNFLTQHGVHLGALLEILLFSQALASLIDDLHKRIAEKSNKLKLVNRSLNHEINERKRIAEELDQHRASMLHMAKMQELGSITAAVAHEVNNPLAVLSMSLGNLDTMAAAENIPQVYRQELSRMSESSNRMVVRITKVVKSLLAYARDSNDEPMAPVMARQVVEDLMYMCKASLTLKQVSLEFGELQDVAFMARSSEITQILLNLVNNAADALKDNDKKIIRIKYVVRGHLGFFHVEDNGPGIPDHLKSHVMQKPFTTKEKGEGTGLGLGICKMLAERNNGGLTYERDETTTSFILRLSVVPTIIVEPRLKA